MADTTEQENELIKCVRKLLNPEDPQAKECKSCACTVKEFFDAIDNPNLGFKVRIPAYQRPYAWGMREVNQLIQDLETKASTESPYHLGTIILHYDKEGGKTFNVVDGQQRLRTFEMLLGMKVEGGESSVFYEPIAPEDQNESLEEKEKKEQERKRRKIPEEVEQWYNGKSGSVKELLEGSVKELLECGTIVCLIVQNIDEAFQLFETQNGRGKPLAMEDLLKAYHYHEMTHGNPSQQTSSRRLYLLEQLWREKVVGQQNDEENGGETSVLSKHLLLARNWARGEEKPKIGRHVGETRVPYLDEYKGLTLGPGSSPLQNPWVLCHMARLFLSDEVGQPLTIQTGCLQTPVDLSRMAIALLLKGYLTQRSPISKDDQVAPLDSFVAICQPIINGDAFFEYAQTFSRMATQLFKEETNPDFDEFHKVYKEILSKKKEGKGYAKRARVVYETFVLLAFDRFGQKGVKSLFKDLWLLAYYERILSVALHYKKAGETYGKSVCALLAFESSLDVVARKVREKRDTAEDGIIQEAIKDNAAKASEIKSRWDRVCPFQDEFQRLVSRLTEKPKVQ